MSVFKLILKQNVKKAWGRRSHPTTPLVAGNAARQRRLIAVKHVVLYCVKTSMSEKEALLQMKRIFGKVVVTWRIFFAV